MHHTDTCYTAASYHHHDTLARAEREASHVPPSGDGLPSRPPVGNGPAMP